MASIYSHRSSLVLGFHGCDASFAEKVVLGKEMLKKSDHDYDWLGHGIYFWENNVVRARQWAEENSKRANSTISNPGVLAAYLDLGFCLDLTDSESLHKLKISYETLVKASEMLGLPIPVNKDPVSVIPKDRICNRDATRVE